MEVTIHQVAELADVSVSTASRILNGGTKGLRKDAVLRAKKVIQAAEKLGYRPNQSARGLVMKRSFNIGFIGSELGNPVRTELVETLRELAYKKGFNLLVSGMRYGAALESVFDNIIERRIDGLIMGNMPVLPQVLANGLLKRNIPVVSFGGAPEKRWDCVVLNYAEMVKQLVEHLIVAHKIKNIIYAGTLAPYSRQEGYKQQMTDSGLLEYIGNWHVREFSLESGRKEAVKMIEAGLLPEAVVCHNDLLAIGIMAGLRDKGLRVPEDIVVIGLDNIEMSQYTNPTLTTAGVNPTTLARNLFEMLIERMERNYTGCSRVIYSQEELFIRESCGCISEREAIKRRRN